MPALAHYAINWQLRPSWAAFIAQHPTVNVNASVRGPNKMTEGSGAYLP